MEAIAYIFRIVVMMTVTWFALRLIGKKSIAQLTSYEFAGIMLLTTIAAEPLVFKIASKAAVGSLAIAVCVLLIGKLSLNSKFYNVDMKPDILIQNGKVNKEALKNNKMNVSLLLSMLRLKGYANLSDIAYAIIEPDGQISVIPLPQSRPVQPSDMQIQTQEEWLPLPIILDGEIQYNNLKYAGFTPDWLMNQLKQANANPQDVFVAQLNSKKQLYFSLYKDQAKGQEPSPL